MGDFVYLLTVPNDDTEDRNAETVVGASTSAVTADTMNAAISHVAHVWAIEADKPGAERVLVFDAGDPDSGWQGALPWSRKADGGFRAVPDWNRHMRRHLPSPSDNLMVRREGGVWAAWEADRG